MSIVQAVILGVVQGITEFLPISSSGHLILMQNLFGLKKASLAFDVVLHLGTLTALLLFFWRDWLKLVKAFLSSLKNWDLKNDMDQRLIWFLIVATIPGALFGLLLEKEVETTFRNSFLVALMLAGLGLLLLIAERAAHKRRVLNSLNLADSIAIGLSQALALIPGVSRAGITITTGLFRGLNRDAAVRFSFLLSAPIIAGAGFSQIPKILREGNTSGEHLIFAVGFLVSAISGYLAIRYLLKYIQKHNLDVFAYYRFLLAAAVIIYILSV